MISENFDSPNADKEQKNDNLKDMNDDPEFYHESRMSYEADHRYSTGFYDDLKNPEQHNYLKNIYESIQEYLDRFIIEYPQFDSLRTMDISKLCVGDPVSISNFSDKKIQFVRIYTIKSLPADKLDEFVLMSGDVEVRVNRKHIKIIDDPILRLKGHEISFIYTNFKDKINVDSHVDFFYVFTEYFKMNEKQVYDSLPNKIKNEILEELNERTGCLRKKNTFDW